MGLSMRIPPIIEDGRASTNEKSIRDPLHICHHKNQRSEECVDHTKAKTRKMAVKVGLYDDPYNQTFKEGGPSASALDTQFSDPRKNRNRKGKTVDIWGAKKGIGKTGTDIGTVTNTKLEKTRIKIRKTKMYLPKKALDRNAQDRSRIGPSVLEKKCNGANVMVVRLCSWAASLCVCLHTQSECRTPHQTQHLHHYKLVLTN
ncbi:hypothetical protein RR48_11151 [Papilio machaon]|uniref:Uncharacterized protein n=1 Tax=Papilio machaon TaxID=76193 RepID=A0A194QRJ0_PAPMA|nr:hypothetical protein RR48_11151 [Papilio machaon]